ncbi:MAG: prepilin-type N-terminal cleavage/methylation domain-containing protein [Magnetococcales bacterium]|nr:prepilin-type N-terminal cleavage/methylation domain-containing protein [Magnetococcales bacterium]
MDNIISKSRESGFTIIELLVAGTLFLLLSLALLQIMLHGEKITETMISQTIKNSQARELFDLLAFGVSDASGYHGSENTDPILVVTNPDVATSQFPTNLRLKLGSSDYETQSLGNTEFEINCTSVNDRLKSCDSIGKVVNVGGYIDSFNQNSVRQVNARTFEIDFTIIDPHMVPRDDKEALYTKSEYSESYWTIFTMNKDNP